MTPPTLLSILHMHLPTPHTAIFTFRPHTTANTISFLTICHFDTSTSIPYQSMHKTPLHKLYGIIEIRCPSCSVEALPIPAMYGISPDKGPTTTVLKLIPETSVNSTCLLRNFYMHHIKWNNCFFFCLVHKLNLVSTSTSHSFCTHIKIKKKNVSCQWHFARFFPSLPHAQNKHKHPTS